MARLVPGVLLFLCACDPGPGFDARGVVTSDFGCGGAAAAGHSVVKTKTGWVAGGAGCDGWVLAGFTPEGRQDPAFGNHGTVVTSTHGARVDVSRLWVRPDGKLLAELFGDGKKTMRAFSASGQPEPALDERLDAALPPFFEAAMAPDGKLVAAIGGTVLRLGLDGTEDPSFGNAGRASLQLPQLDGAPCTPAVGADGTVALMCGVARPWVARLTPSGALDQAVWLQPAPDSVTIVWTLAVQDDHGVILGGSAGASGGPEHPTLWRLTPAGTMDDAFGDHGQADGVHFAVRGHFEALVALPDGRFLGAATISEGAKDGRMEWAVGRYGGDGQADPGFHGRGVVTFDLGAASTVGGPSSLAADEDGCVVTGVARDFQTMKFALARVTN